MGEIPIKNIMLLEIFGLNGLEEMLAAQEALVDEVKRHENSKFDGYSEEKTSQDKDDMDMSGAGGPDDDQR